ncbi:hypothetical protein T492DRAFT_832568 [Pavlovales sp. CCMP2436]|nr:hypothetical protein T492DRAFT_832568 [Pavlovales sp. CCMP2436]
MRGLRLLAACLILCVNAFKQDSGDSLGSFAYFVICLIFCCCFSGGDILVIVVVVREVIYIYNKPPTGNFLQFSSEKRAAVKTANPGITFGESAKKLGAMWHGLDPSEKLVSRMVKRSGPAASPLEPGSPRIGNTFNINPVPGVATGTSARHPRQPDASRPGGSQPVPSPTNRIYNSNI